MATVDALLPGIMVRRRPQGRPELPMNVVVVPPSPVDCCTAAKEAKTIYAITPFTLQDFPGKPACIVWFAGCNLACTYCHNAHLIHAKGQLSEADVLSFLQQRQGLLQGVVLSGGEATLYPRLPALVRAIKALGFSVKLDTNGTNLPVVKTLVEQGLVDAVALDFKAPPQLFQAVTGKTLFHYYEATVRWLCQQTTCPVTIRTTVDECQLDQRSLQQMKTLLHTWGYKGEWHLQPVRLPSVSVAG